MFFLHWIYEYEIGDVHFFIWGVSGGLGNMAFVDFQSTLHITIFNNYLENNYSKVKLLFVNANETSDLV